MTQRINSDQFGRPACLAAFAVSVGVLFAAITGSVWPPRAGSVWPPFDKLLRRAEYPAFVSVRVAWLRRTLGKGRP